MSKQSGNEKIASVPTIRDVARIANVAIGTVSRVLNGHPTVGEDIRQRVLNAATLLRYQPDIRGQSLRLGTTRTVACAVRDVSIPGFSGIVDAAAQALKDRGYTLLLAITGEQKEEELKLFRTLAQRKVDAIITTTSSERDDDLNLTLTQLGIPVVLLDRDTPSSLDAVRINHRAAIRTATKYLIDLRHSRIALLTGGATMRPARERIKGFEEAIDQAGLSKIGIVRPCGFSSERAFRETSLLLREKDRPTAIIAGGMAMLPGVLRALRDFDLKIPDDISVIAGADTDLAALFDPPVTAISWNERDQGRFAVELLLDRIAQPDARVNRVDLPTELIIRNSCSVAR